MKFVVPVIAGLVVAFLVGFGLNFLMAAGGDGKGDGGGPGLATLLPAVLLGVFTTYIMANLAGNRRVAGASDEARRGALAFTAPSDRARLYVVREGFLGMAPA